MPNAIATKPTPPTAGSEVDPLSSPLPIPTLLTTISASCVGDPPLPLAQQFNPNAQNAPDSRNHPSQYRPAAWAAQLMWGAGADKQGVMRLNAATDKAR